MLRNTLIAALLASSALSLAVTTPADAASQRDRARDAIAAAEAKLHTAETLGAATEAPRDTAEARAALATAKEEFKTGDRGPAIEAAIRAQALADTAIGISQKHKDNAVAEAQAAQQATVSSAQDQVAAAKDQAAMAQDQAAAAQQQAAQANAQAQTAQQAAAASAADAAAARNAAALAAAQTPPQVETTVTTQHTATSHPKIRTKIVRRAVTTTPSTTEQITTTTKVTPQQ